MNWDEILNGAMTAFINQHASSSADFKPKLLYNNQNSKVINSIRDELRDCDEFIISSAFITMGGITPLLEEFRYLENNNIKGKILTTDYLNFTEPKALRKLPFDLVFVSPEFDFFIGSFPFIIFFFSDENISGI